MNNVGMRSGHAEIVKELGKGKVVIRCDCSFEKEVYKSNFMRDSHQSCGRKDCPYHKTGRKLGSVSNDLTHKRFGILEVIQELGGDKVLVRCDCGTEKVMWKASLTKEQAYSCGCLSKKYPGCKLDMLGKVYNSLKVIEPATDGYVIVQCECGKIFRAQRRHVREGNVKSCGCKQREYLIETSIQRFGDIRSRSDKPRQMWQIEAMNNPDKFREVVAELNKKLGHKATVDDICKVLDTKKATVLIRIKQADATDLVTYFPYVSAPESELFQYIQSLLPNEKIERNVRRFNGVTEIDIFIPSKNIGIEFNGIYWHCSLNKDRLFHQNKSLACIENGVRLIHIYEYEWKNPDEQEKIKRYLNSVLSDNKSAEYARNLKVVKLDNVREKAFINENHLQGYANSTVCYGLVDKDNKIMSLMSFGKPRFNQDAEWEIVRYCNLDGVAIVGGAEKLFSAFINENNPQSVQTYASLDKFDGSVYSRLGFTKTSKPTAPGYVWVQDNTYKTLTRYQTMKKDLVEKGLGTEDQTEDEIMYGLGYYKVYNAGNLNYMWANK